MTDKQQTNASGETRVSNLVGDRLCATCGYNLTGQPVLREPHYQMLIVRCPECATVASVQEYPLLGRWANRWAAIFAGLWVIFLTGFWFGSGMAIFGLSMGFAAIAYDDYNDFVWDEYRSWESVVDQSATLGSTAPANTTVLPDGSVITVQRPRSRLGSDFDKWWVDQDPHALFASAGGWSGAFNDEAYFMLIWLSLVPFVLGCAWATILFSRRRRIIPLFALVILIVPCIAAGIVLSEWMIEEPTWPSHVGERFMGPPMLCAAIGFATIWLTAGLIFGRPVVRGIVTLFLPPRMRSSLAFLWLADNLEPPTTTSPRQ